MGGWRIDGWVGSEWMDGWVGRSWIEGRVVGWVEGRLVCGRVDGWWVVLFQLLLCNLHFDLVQVAGPYPTTAEYPKPDYPGPHTFIALVVTVMIICGLLDLLS